MKTQLKLNQLYHILEINIYIFLLFACWLLILKKFSCMMFIQFIRKIMFLRSRWVDDATGLAPPCIAVLRSCHSLAASLTTIAGTVNSNTVPLEIVDVRAVIVQYCSTVLLFRITGYFCLGCSTHTASRGRCCPQSVSTIGCQAAGSQSGGSRIGCNSLGTGNQARCTEESSQETGIY